MSDSSYWCYSCRSFVRIRLPAPAISCPDCGGGFLEEAPPPPPPPHSPLIRRSSAATGDRSPFNPVIVLRGPSDNSNPPAAFEFYYDDGAGSGLRPLPATVSDFLMGSGFDRLLDQLSQLELTGAAARAADHPPASKSAIESMPTITISESHIASEPHCAVCKEAFVLDVKAREMPCKHIYHHDCILPWLLIRNSCPVCRHELPADQRENQDDSAVGLTIWRLPGGGFAVGRFSGGRRAGNRELPIVYTEMDGGFNVGGAPRRVSWSSGGNRARESGGVARAVRNFFSFFRRSRSSSSSLGSGSSSRSRRRQVEASRRSRGN